MRMPVIKAQPYRPFDNVEEETVAVRDANARQKMLGMRWALRGQSIQDHVSKHLIPRRDTNKQYAVALARLRSRDMMAQASTSCV